MDKLHLMTVYVAVAESRSFAAGARRLGMSPPAVTRAVALLEHELGVKLLTRTTRHVRVTDAGQRYLDDVRRILGEVAEADEAAAGINAEPRGHLTVTAPSLFGRMFVLPGIVEFLQRHPAMEVSALLLDRVVNMLEEGVNVAVRIGELPDSSMTAIRVGQVRRVACAAPQYLAAHGTPLTPAALAQYCIINTNNMGAGCEWKFGHAATATTVHVRPRLSVTTNDAAIEAAMQGFGIARILSYQVAALFETGALVPILSDYEPPAMPIHVIYREGRHASAKVRSFVDMMVQHLQGDCTLR
ncbi:LysR family transcriptional regulator [Sulfuriferula sp. AH1]|uniref:LysR family transcriptional regulator n=1 Tax=Sulfuriferula sp. AH1 TaxID=1985873 RepID=UPI000B3B3BCC|nr:LysR family transcriptional regulator [Sulfuriferula sp. AH1]ARU30372.1 LysR family transcriptional regulator [Sulfuriferula sp. AH1]